MSSLAMTPHTTPTATKLREEREYTKYLELLSKSQMPFVDLQEKPFLSDAESASFLFQFERAIHQIGRTSRKERKMITTDKFRVECMALSKKIFESQETLRQLLDRHETQTFQRWSKKSPDERAGILRRAFPGISETHHPDLRQLYSEFTLSNHDDLIPFMFPDLNAKVLSEGRNLPLFLRSRARNHLSAFVYSDFEATQLGRILLKAVPQRVSDRYSKFPHITLLGPRDTENYVQVLEVDRPQIFETDFRFRLDHGLFILQIQNTKFGFSVNSIREILHDKGSIESLIKIPAPALDHEIPDNLELFEKKLKWSKGAIRNSERPRTLSNFDKVQRLLDTISSRKGLMEEHIRSLREDPTYFAESPDEAERHREQYLESEQGIRNPLFVKDEFWTQAIAQSLSDAYSNSMVWDVVCTSFSSLMSLVKQYPEALSLEDKLPRELMLAISSIDSLIHCPMQKYAKTLRRIISGSEPLCPYFTWMPIPGRGVGNYEVVRRKSAGLTEVLFLLLECAKARLTQICPFHFFVDELERLLQEPENLEYLSSLVVDNLTSLGLLCQIQQEIKQLFPWVSVEDFRKKEKTQEKSTSRGLDKDTKPLLDAISKSMTDFLDKDTLRATKVVRDLDQLVCHPQKRNKKSVDPAIKAERHLDSFWAKVDKEFKRSRGVSVEDVYDGRFSSQWTLHRTEEWVERPRSTKRASKPASSALEQTPRENQNALASQSQLPEKGSTKKTDFIKERMNKEKTRGVQNPPNNKAKSVGRTFFQPWQMQVLLWSTDMAVVGYSPQLHLGVPQISCSTTLMEPKCQDGRQDTLGSVWP